MESVLSCISRENVSRKYKDHESDKKDNHPHNATNIHLVSESRNENDNR